MKMGKKTVSIVIVCLLILSFVLAGCSKAPDTPADKGTPSAKPTETPAEKPDQSSDEQDDDLKNTLYPIANGDITLKIWMPIHSIATKYIQTYAENEAFIQAMEDTGVKLEFTHPASGQESEQFNLMIASQEYPDIAFQQKYKGGVVQGVTDGIYEDLTELIPEYAPDYYALIQQNDEFRREATTADGKIYAFYIYKDVDAAFEGEWRRTQFRKDWLDEFGMEIPKTFEEYEAFFEKVLEAKPGVAPFILEPSGIEKQLLAPFDMSTDEKRQGHVVWCRSRLQGISDSVEQMV
jgi:putative aldouronate transport system substrate-binding protein